MNTSSSDMKKEANEWFSNLGEDFLPKNTTYTFGEDDIKQNPKRVSEDFL